MAFLNLRRMTRPLDRIFLRLVVAMVLASPAAAYDRLEFSVTGGGKELKSAIKSNSLLQSARNDDQTDPNDILATALADYARILETLYDQGYYGGVIHILIDGREAASIGPFAAPSAINTVQVIVQPGRLFHFGATAVRPLAPGTAPLDEFGRGEVAASTVVRDAVQTAVTDWREAGHAKVTVQDQTVVADHRTATLDANIVLAPGPRVTFGDLIRKTPSNVRAARIARIAGFPSGEVFSPKALEAVAERLRKTGAFSSVSLRESEALGPGNTLDVELRVVDDKPRRFGAGIELSSLEGLALSGYWLHRNLLGGAERFRVDAEVSDITAAGDGVDYKVAARLDKPAAFGRATGAYLSAEIAYLDEPAFLSKQGGFGLGLNRDFSDTVSGEAGINYRYSITEDVFGERRFSLLSLPISGEWDKRDEPLNPAAGFYLDARFEPFYEFEGNAAGARAKLDGRVYRGFGSDDRIVLAGRGQIGAVVGAESAEVPPDYLFFSGGPGTVRGFPFQSLAIDAGGGEIIGGRAFIGVSAEVRYRLSDRFGVVGFVDYGSLGGETFFDDAGGTQTGAGLGLRYYSGFGPIRLDVATPVSGANGDGVQVYIGIGQSF